MENNGRLTALRKIRLSTDLAAPARRADTFPSWWDACIYWLA